MRRTFFALAAIVAGMGAACGSSSNGNSGFDSGTGSGSGGGDSGTDGSVGMTCTGGKTACGTSCVDTTTDSANCGKCGVSCGGGICCASVCVDQTASCSFSVTGVNPLQGNQNGGDWVTITGSGFVAGMRVYIGTGAAPAHIVDPQHALVLTPPLTVGNYDIKIASGAMTSVLPKSYLSVAGSEMPPWTEKPMKFVRGEDPGLAVLQDGRVLVAGGTTVPDSATNALASAEIYTRMNDSVTSAPGSMSAPRIQNAAVTLLDGKVLVVGGAGWGAVASNNNTPSVSADLFDATSGTFAPTAHPLTTARAGIRAALAWDGRVVITSGGEATADIYDPVADTFTNMPLLAMHTYGFMVRMRDGRIMIGAGDGGQTAVEIFDPAQNKFFMAPSLNQGRSMLTAHTLPDGRIMVIGGASMSAGSVDVPLSSIETYDPATNKWTVAPYQLSTGRCWHASALVSDGTVLVMGGYNVDKSCMLTAAAQIVDQVDPVLGTVKPFGMLPHPNTEWTAVTLHDGSVLGVGGGACGTPMALPSLDFLPGKPPTQ
jgi:hypothetical protein